MSIVVAFFVMKGAVGANAEPPNDTDPKSVEDENDSGGADSQNSENTEETDGKERTEGEFRGHTWGTSMDEVIDEEGEPDDKNSDQIVYEDGQISGIDVAYIMWFGDDGLEQARYVVTETHRNSSKHIYNFRTLNEALVDKYGGPNEENIRNRDDNEYTDMGTELVSGDLSFLDIWHFPKRNMRITHLLNRTSDGILHWITYYSIDEWRDQKRENEENTEKKL